MAMVGSLLLLTQAVMLASLVMLSSADTFLHVRPHTEKSVSREVVRQTFVAALSMDVNQVHKLEDELRPMYAALPKNAHGALDSSVVRYALHRYFVQKHGWHIKGLEPSSHTTNTSSPARILKDRVPEYVQSLLEEHVSGQGWQLHELAICVAALSELIQGETIQDLEFVYSMVRLPTSSMLDDTQLDNVIEWYLAQYLVDESFTRMNPSALMMEIKETYAFWDDLSMWAKDLRRSLDFAQASSSNPFTAKAASFSRVAEIVQEIMSHYTSFQNLECSAMTDVMLNLEHKGTGRVPLAEFYKAGIDEVWKFWEPIKYLQHAGILDESNPARPTVIIPNYVTGMPNCLASSSFFAVCCSNKCEHLVGHLEQALAAPSAEPQRIASLVSRLPSDTVDAPRDLSAQLLARLSEIAEHHGGEVPLHGRLFSQWLHHAYPRECPFPHADGVKNPLTPEAWSEASGQDFSLEVEEMRRHVRAHSRGVYEHSEELPWVNTEELVGVQGRRGWGTSALRKGMALVFVVSIMIPLLRTWSSFIGASEPEHRKHMV